jgi:hypothetical protein
MKINESIVKEAALEWFREQSRFAPAPHPDLPPAGEGETARGQLPFGGNQGRPPQVVPTRSRWGGKRRVGVRFALSVGGADI